MIIQSFKIRSHNLTRAKMQEFSSTWDPGQTDRKYFSQSLFIEPSSYFSDGIPIVYFN